MAIDEERFPRLAAYLASLPNGLDTYPECLAKASLLHYARRQTPPTFSLDGLPNRVRSQLEAKKLAATWITETEYVAATLALWDGAKLSDDDACDCWYRVVKDLRASVLYRAIMSFVSPGRMMRGATLTWQQFHKGTTIRVVDETKSSTVLELVSPAGLYPPLILTAFGWVFQASVEPSPTPIAQRVRQPETQPGRTRYHLTY